MFTSYELAEISAQLNTCNNDIIDRILQKKLSSNRELNLFYSADGHIGVSHIHFDFANLIK